MSLNALIDLATSREQGNPTRRPRFGSVDDEGKRQDENASPVTSTGSVLVAAIPSEVLVVYTGWVTISASRFRPIGTEMALDTAQRTDLWQLRVGVAVVAAIGLAGYLYQGWRAAETRRRRAPWPEISAALIAFGAWALAMPDGLIGLVCSTEDLTVASAASATIGVLLLIGISGPLKRQAKQ